MRPFLLILLLTGCSQAAPPETLPPSPCTEEQFEGSAFTVCDPGAGSIEIRSGYRSFPELQAALGKRSAQVAFAMNAGMFDDAGLPIGLMIEDGREVHAINRRRGFGNFHLMPNGVFLVRKSGATDVLSSDSYKASPTPAFATQSGPMLLIDGKLHPRFEPDGQSRYIRNGVGITPEGKPLFVISVDAVSFGRFARFLLDRHRVKNALFFDGSVSSLWDPANNRMDNFAQLGPILVAFKPSAASAPHRASHATP